MRIDMVPVVDYEEIFEELGLETMDDFHFYNRADDYVGYFWVNTDEDAIPDLEQEIESDKEFCKSLNTEPDEEYFRRLENDIALVKLFRNLGYTDGILVYVWD